MKFSILDLRFAIKKLCAFVPLCLCAFLPAFCLEIQNGAISNITRISATVYGTLVSTNGSGTNPVCTLYYGTSDGLTNLSNWSFSVSLTNVALGSFSNDLTGLAPAQKYYFTWSAVEGATGTWAASSSNFWTLAGAPTNPYPATTSGVFQVVGTNGDWLGPTKGKVIAANDLATGVQISNLQSSIAGFTSNIADIVTNVLDGGREGDGSVTRTGPHEITVTHPAPTAVTGAVAQVVAGAGVAVSPEGGQGYVTISISNTVLDKIDGALTNEPEFAASPSAGISSNDIAAWRGGAAWSCAPATQDVTLADYGLSGVSYMTLGGATRTNWPVEYDPSAWSQYPAEDDVNVNNLTLYNVAWIQLGGVYRDSWPSFTNWADGPASADVDLAGHTLSNGAISGCTIAGYATNDHLHAQYLTNSSGWSGFGATQTVNLANHGLQNVAAIGLGGVTYSNWPTFNSTQFFAKVNLGNTNLFTNLVSGAPWPLNIKGTDSARAQMSIIGGVMTTNQVSGLPGYAEQYTNTLTPRRAWGYAGVGPITNLCVEDGFTATSLPSSAYPSYSDILRLSFWNMNVPLNVIVQGIKIEAEVASYEGTSTFTVYTRIYDGSTTSSAYNVEATFPSTNTWGTTYSWGASNTLWGMELSPTVINANDFAVELWAEMKSSQPQYWIFLRNIHVTVYYTSDELAWTHGVNAAGEYTIRNERLNQDVVTVGSNSVTVPALTLGGETRTNWPVGGGGGAVSSVFGRTGEVTAVAGDYAAYYAGTGDMAQAQGDIDDLRTATNALNVRVDGAAEDASAATNDIAGLTAATGTLNTVVGELTTNTAPLQAFIAVSNVAAGALPAAGGEMTGVLTNNYGFGMGTNKIVMFGGVLSGTNGIYWQYNGTNYWLLLTP
jgi:hypothetical protein